MEYVVIDDALRPRQLVEPAFRVIHGRPTSEIEWGEAGFSNELAAHVFELKTMQPERSLPRAERHLVAGLKKFSSVLRDQFSARLLPTAMHPFMHPSETRLWPRAGQRIYRTYARIFDIHQHGWLNVQATHVNLPFGSERETMALHNAIACLIPYLPALAASSPIFEGKLGPAVDNRLAFYRVNQRRFPSITGQIVPEFVGSYREYRRRILKPIYRALDHVVDGQIIQHEWVNSRGAIMRFMRDAIEIRVLDTQECIKADVAIAAFIRSVLRHMTKQTLHGDTRLPDHRVLVADLDAVIRHGLAANVMAPHIRVRRQRARTARHVLDHLLSVAADEVPKTERRYLPIVEARVSRGNLSERIRRTVRRRAPRPGRRRREVITGIYEELATCLQDNVTWDE